MSLLELMFLLEAKHLGTISITTDEEDQALCMLQADGYLNFGLVDGGEVAECDLTGKGLVAIEKLKLLLKEWS